MFYDKEDRRGRLEITVSISRSLAPCGRPRQGGIGVKIQYDIEVDALYIEFYSLAPGAAEAKEFSEDVIANFGPDGKLAGLEILNASALLGETPGKMIMEITPSFRLAA